MKKTSKSVKIIIRSAVIKENKIFLIQAKDSPSGPHHTVAAIRLKQLPQHFIDVSQYHFSIQFSLIIYYP